MAYVNIDRYTGKQVGPKFKTFCEAQNALRGFRCSTMMLHRKGLIPCF